ncbi:MAG: PfkB family carbohydrate kinase [Pseudomonadota bacterium]
MLELGRVLVFGAAGIDTLARSTLQEGESVPGTITTSLGGVACNVALNLARLGVDVGLVSCVGDDDDGRRVVREIAESGVDTRYVSIRDAQSTARYVALLDAEGDMRLAVSSMRAVEALAVADIQALQNDRRQAAAVVVDANLSEATLRAVLQRDSDAVRCVDTVSAAKAVRVRENLRNIDVLKTTPAEASALTGVGAERIDALCNALLERGAGSVFLSMGARGLRVASRESAVTLAARSPESIQSTSGAGDALLAGIVYGRLTGEDIVGAAELGLAAATLTLSSGGSTLPALTRDLLEETRKHCATNA